MVAGALVLSACTAGTTEPPAVESETAAAGVSSEQFASIIAESRRPVDEWLENWQNGGCSAVAVEQGDPLCSSYLVSGKLTAETAKLKMEGATKPGVPAYIGEPPSDVAIVWGSTEDVAAAAADAGAALPEDCSADAECVNKVFVFVSAMRDLQSKYDAWEPFM